MNKDVPVVLGKVWIGLARNSEADQEVRKRALQNLIKSLGSVEAIPAYMKRHNIK